MLNGSDLHAGLRCPFLLPRSVSPPHTLATPHPDLSSMADVATLARKISELERAHKRVVDNLIQPLISTVTTSDADAAAERDAASKERAAAAVRDAQVRAELAALQTALDAAHAREAALLARVDAADALQATLLERVTALEARPPPTHAAVTQFLGAEAKMIRESWSTGDTPEEIFPKGSVLLSLMELVEELTNWQRERGAAEAATTIEEPPSLKIEKQPQASSSQTAASSSQTAASSFRTASASISASATSTSVSAAPSDADRKRKRAESDQTTSSQRHTSSSSTPAPVSASTFSSRSSLFSTRECSVESDLTDLSNYPEIPEERRTSGRARKQARFEGPSAQYAKPKRARGPRKVNWPAKTYGNPQLITNLLECNYCAGWLHLSCAGLLIDAPVLDKTKNRKFRCPECKFRNKHNLPYLDRAGDNKCFRPMCGGNSSAEEEFVMESVVGRRPAPYRSTGWEYLVKWEGYPIDESTWEDDEVNASALESVIGPFNDRVMALELADLDSREVILLPEAEILRGRK